MNRYLCVFLGGGAGCLTRYLVGRAILQRFPSGYFAWSTFCINVTGSFLIGFLMTLLVERLKVPHFWQLLLVTGFLGGYTTFSSFEYEGYLAVRAGQPLTALAYLAGSVIAGCGAVWLGVLIVGRR
ncbi:MAG TPA: fluoride efflux transporter CrcB [Bryobacteraceae bacterium]|jgi:CrcB protein|nr:fluoride efflux transporter CrcB [Bryobacteraceae bacterium]